MKSIGAPACARWLRLRRGLAAVAIVAGATPATAADGQELRSFGPDRSCACSIILHRFATLGRADDTVSIGERSVVARGAKGGFYAAPVHPPGTVAILDSKGVLLGTVGRPGRGPGELTGVRHVRTTANDAVLVLERERLSQFGPDRAYVRSSALPAGLVAFRFITLRDGTVILNNYFPTRRAFTVLDSLFKEQRTFGPSIAANAFPDSDGLQYVLAPLDDGRFAAVKQHYEFRVEIWDTTGTLRRVFRRDPEWFPRWTYAEALARGPRSPPYPAVLGAFADVARRELWVTAIVPDRAWGTAAQPASGAGPRREVPGPELIPLSDFRRAYDTVIEVLDLDTGAVKVAQRFDAFMPYFMEGGLLYGLREEASGLYVVDVVRPVIVRSR